MKKIVSIFLIMIISLLCLQGCGKKEEKKKGNEFIEKQCSLPETVKDILDIRKSDDGKIKLISGNIFEDESSDNDCIEYYISSDKGNTWEKQNIDLSSINKGDMCPSAGITKEGEIYFLVTSEDSNKIFKVDKDLNCSQVQLKEEINDIYQIKLVGDYILFESASEEKREVVQVNKDSGEIINRYELKDNEINDLVGNSLIVYDFDKVVEYNLKDGKKSKGNKELTKIITDYKNGTNKIFGGEKEDSGYLCNNRGAYKINLKDYKKTKIIDGSNTSFGDKNKDCIKFFNIDKDEYMGAFINYGNGGQCESTLAIYEKNKNKENVKELSIYSIEQNDTIEQWVNAYQVENSNVKINYDYAIGYEEMIEENESKISDAIKSLNSKIMSGDGPDIILLNDLPIKSYVNKGLILDITDVVNGLNKEEYFTNVFDSTKINDKNYFIPTNLSFNVVINENASEINSLDKLSNSIETIANNSNGNVLPTFNSRELVNLLYSSCSTQWINEDNSINENSLKEFLQYTKNIYDKTNNKHTQKMKDIHDENIKEWKKYTEKDYADCYYSYYDFSDQFTDEPNSVDIIRCNSASDLMILLSVKDKYKNVNFDIWKGQGDAEVISELSLGISSKSKNIDLAKDFLKKVISTSYMKKVGYGTPINKKVYNDQIKENLKIEGGSICFSEDTEVEYNLTNVSEEDIKKITEKIESCKCAIDIDEEILEMAIDPIIDYIEGKSDIDQAVANISKELNIYLNE